MDFTDLENTCPYCNERSTLRISIPRDWRRPDILHSYDIFECVACDYGYIFPRPNASDIPSFYKIDNYYTHRKSGKSNEEQSFTFLQRLRFHLAWRLDKGKETSSDWWVATLGTKPLTVLEIGCGIWRRRLFFKVSCDRAGKSQS